MLRLFLRSREPFRRALPIDARLFACGSRSASSGPLRFFPVLTNPVSSRSLQWPSRDSASASLAVRNFGKTRCAFLPRKNDDEGSSKKNDEVDDDTSENGKKLRPLKLMELAEHMWPSPLKALRNYFMMVFIRGYFDPEFSVPVFLTGAEQAVVQVSSLISRGQFGGLRGLVTREAIDEIERNYRRLEVKQKQFIAVNPKDLFIRFVYEIGIIFDDETNKRFVEITTVIQGCHGLGVARMGSDYAEEMKKSQDQLYTCNYRFLREYTKGVESDWTINKLNHFKPTELVKQRGLFSR